MDEQDLFIITEYIREFLTSKKRQLMIDGDLYYINEPPDINMPHAFMSNMIDEKVQYLVGNEPIITSNINDSQYLQNVLETISDTLLYKLNELSTEASNKGIAWEQIYFEDNHFKRMIIPSEEVVPIWTDNSHTELKWLVRVYDIEEYNGASKKTVTKAEIYDNEKTYYYIYESGRLRLDSERYLKLEDGQEFGHFTINDVQYSMGKIPFVWCKNNSKELPDLKFVKDLIDKYCDNRERMDNLLEDFKNFLVIIRNYDGSQESTDSLDDMLKKRRVWVDTDGGVELVSPTIDTTASESHNNTLKDDIILFGRSVDRNKMVSGQAPSGVALKTLYSGLDLKCNKLDVEIKNYFSRLLYFVDQYLRLIGKHSKSEKEVITLILNRDVTMNESDVIKDCQNSMGVISNKTIIKNHPWVTDIEDEMGQIEAEQPTVNNYPNLPEDPLNE